MKHTFALIAIVCFLIALLKSVGWLFGSSNEESFLVGGFLAFGISWLYSDAPRSQAPTQAQPSKPQTPPEREQAEHEKHIGMR